MAVKIPPYIPLRMTAGAKSPHIASLKACHISLGVPHLSPFHPCRCAMMHEGIMRSNAVIIPGMTPAAKRAGTEVLVMTP